MTRSSVEEFLKDWTVTTKKIFVYKQEFLKDEYLTIEKNVKIENNEPYFTIISLESTTTIDNLDSRLFELMLVNEELREHKGDKWFTSIMSFKTDGCECGAWATVNPKNHAFWCRKSFR